MAYGSPPPHGYGSPQQPGQAPAPNLWQSGAAPHQQQWQPPGSGAPAAPPRRRGRPSWNPASGPVSDTERNWATMAYVGQFLVAGLAPLIVLMLRGRSPFVRAHAVQGLNMGLAAVAVWLGAGLLSMIFTPVMLGALAFTGVCVFFQVRAGVDASQARFTEVPVFVAWPLLK